MFYLLYVDLWSRNCSFTPDRQGELVAAPGLSADCHGGSLSEVYFTVKLNWQMSCLFQDELKEETRQFEVRNTPEQKSSSPQTASQCSAMFYSFTCDLDKPNFTELFCVLVLRVEEPEPTKPAVLLWRFVLLVNSAMISATKTPLNSATRSVSS